MNSPSSFSSSLVRTLLWYTPAEVCGQPAVLTTSAIRPITTRRVRHKASLWDSLSLFADILELRAWRRMNPLEGFLLAAYMAAVAQPVVYGSLGNSIVALMTPVR